MGYPDACSITINKRMFKSLQLLDRLSLKPPRVTAPIEDYRQKALVHFPVTTIIVFISILMHTHLL